MMRLIGGPWNNRLIHDIGTDDQRMTIYSEFDKNKKPMIGCSYGYSIYEPNEERTHSFWLENVWLGIFEKVYEGQHFNPGE